MPLSNKVKIPFPSENKPNWYSDFVSMVDTIDGSLYAAREDRNLLMMGGGTVSFEISGDVGTLAWDEDIQILSATKGFSCIIPAGTLDLNDTELFYINLTRDPLENVEVETIIASSLSGSVFPDDALLIGYRTGTLVYFFGGYILGEGESGPLFSETTLGAAALSDNNPTTINAGDTADPGIGGAASRYDHQHAVETASAGDLVAVDASAASAGVSTKLPRADHKHTISTGVPGNITFTTAAQGSAITLAKSDHTHGMVSGTPSNTGTANSEGASSNPARVDHVHKTNFTAQSSGVLTGTRGAFNFGSNFSLADNGGSDRVDINTVSSPTFTGLTLSSFTQGSVVFAGVGGLLSQDNSNLFFDDGNNRLGINTNSPCTSLSNGSTLITDDFIHSTLTTGINWRRTENSPGWVAAIENTNDAAYSHGLMIKIARNFADIVGTNALYVKCGTRPPLVVNQGTLTINRISTPSGNSFCTIEMASSGDIDKIGFDVIGNNTTKGSPYKGVYAHTDALGTSYTSAFTPYNFSYEHELSLGTTSDDYNTFTFKRKSTRDGGSFTSTGSVTYIENILTGTVTDTTDVLKLVQDSASSGTNLACYVDATPTLIMGGTFLNVDNIQCVSGGDFNICVSGAPKLVLDATTFEIQDAMTLTTTLGGNINLPNNGGARFKIESTSVGTTVTAPNLDTLTDTSFADDLHKHEQIVTTATSGEAISIGQLLSFDNDGGNARAFLADATDTNELCNAVGFAKTSAGSAGLAIEIIVDGVVEVDSSFFDSAPGAADVGKRVYMSETSGKVTLDVSGFSSGSTILKIGILLDDNGGGGGGALISIQIGDGIVVP